MTTKLYIQQLSIFLNATASITPHLFKVLFR